MSEAGRVQAGVESARRGRRGALLPYVTAGFPDLAATGELLRVCDRPGVGAIEVGIPYSDSIADGPTINASYQAALARRLRVEDVFACTAEVSAGMRAPLVAMVSYSIVFRHGAEDFCARARAAGFAGLIVPDVALEESAELSRVAAGQRLELVLLTSPTSSAERRAQIAARSRGFVYHLSVAGITGERGALPAELSAQVRALRGACALPICVGFGIATAAQVRAVCEAADGAIVGSAIVRRIDEAARAGATAGQIAERVGAFVVELLAALDAGPAGA